MTQITTLITTPISLPGDPKLPAPLTEGLSHQRANRLADAERIYLDFLENNPNHPQALAFLGSIRAQNAQYDSALELLYKAIQENPDLADAQYCAGKILSVCDEPLQAINFYRRALELGHPQAKESLATAEIQLETHNQARNFRLLSEHYLSLNLPDLAIENSRQAIHLNPGDLSNWLSFSNSISRIHFTTAVGDDLLSDIADAFMVENLDYRQIVRAALSALAHNEHTATFFRPNEPAESPVEYLLESMRNGTLAPLLDNRLLLSILAVAIVTDLASEQLLTALRTALLMHITSSHPNSEDKLNFLPLLAGIAQQCFLNEYVWPVSPIERDTIANLESDLAKQLAADAEIPSSWVAAVGSYKPLHKQAYAQRLQSLEWQQPVDAVIRMQITEPFEETDLRSGIPNVMPITGEVSSLVRSQYEENPFPRWSTLPIQGKAISLADHMDRLFPHLTPAEREQPESPKLLVAGCGTGLIPNYFAKHIAQSTVTALDLSLSSLAYAKRKTIELGIHNIEYIHGDILKLHMLNRQFDHINCYGVLHHMQDTETGWRALKDCLRPGGTMEIGLYSKIARRPVSRAHEFIREQGYRPTPEDMRQCRQDIIDRSDDELLYTITNAPDFYSMSEFRDLVFHYQEHFLTLPQISNMINTLGLQFLGFVFQDPTVIPRYKKMFPHDTGLRSLELWDKFETENPMTFASIYDFWVRKPA